MRQQTLVIFARAPVAGRTKTRLGRDIGMIAAAWWYRHQLARLVRRVGRDPRWRTVLAVAPDQAVASRHWPPGVGRWAQGPGDLGQRMGRALREMPAGPVIVIGADIPEINANAVAEGFALLRRNDAVLGPATDGGYWMIGLARAGRALPHGLFKGVRWSGPHALADTRASLGGLRIGEARQLADVDEAADLRTTGQRPKRLSASSSGRSPSRS